MRDYVGRPCHLPSSLVFRTCDSDWAEMGVGEEEVCSIKVTTSSVERVLLGLVHRYTFRPDSQRSKDRNLDDCQLHVVSARNLQSLSGTSKELQRITLIESTPSAATQHHQRQVSSPSSESVLCHLKPRIHNSLLSEFSSSAIRGHQQRGSPLNLEKAVEKEQSWSWRISSHRDTRARAAGREERVLMVRKNRVVDDGQG